VSDLAGLHVYAEADHRLTSRGAVVSHVAVGTSQAGFDAEWRMVYFAFLDGGLLTRGEIFEDANLDAALARFEELNAPTRLPANAASRAYKRLRAMFAARNWDALTDLLDENIRTDDRRRVINAGIRKGRDAALAELSSFIDIGAQTIASDVIATRGDRLALHRWAISIRECSLSSKPTKASA
jgi:hypothetical protein